MTEEPRPRKEQTLAEGLKEAAEAFERAIEPEVKRVAARRRATSRRLRSGFSEEHLRRFRRRLAERRKRTADDLFLATADQARAHVLPGSRPRLGPEERRRQLLQKIEEYAARLDALHLQRRQAGFQQARKIDADLSGLLEGLSMLRQQMGLTREDRGKLAEILARYPSLRRFRELLGLPDPRPRVTGKPGMRTRRLETARRTRKQAVRRLLYDPATDLLEEGTRLRTALRRAGRVLRKTNRTDDEARLRRTSRRLIEQGDVEAQRMLQRFNQSNKAFEQVAAAIEKADASKPSEDRRERVKARRLRATRILRARQLMTKRDLTLIKAATKLAVMARMRISLDLPETQHGQWEAEEAHWLGEVAEATQRLGTIGKMNAAWQAHKMGIPSKRLFSTIDKRLKRFTAATDLGPPEPGAKSTHPLFSAHAQYQRAALKQDKWEMLSPNPLLGEPKEVVLARLRTNRKLYRSAVRRLNPRRRPGR